MFMRPERLAAYQEQYWDDSAEKVQYALASTLLWLPFLIIRLATSFNAVPNALYTQAMLSPLEWGGILIGLWLLTWWLGQRPMLRGDLLILQILPAAMLMPLTLADNLWYSGGILIVLVVPFGISGGIARRMKGKRGFVFAWYGAIITTIFVNPLAILGGIWLLIGSSYAVDMVLDDVLKTRYSSEFSRLFFSLYLLACAALVWLYGFGGQPIFSK
jgi:ABC-type molybdate transport system permease subunit